MKLTTWQRFQYTGVVYFATPDLNDAQGRLIYTRSDLVMFFEFMGNPLSVRSVIISRTPLPLKTILVGIVDKDGEAINGNAQYKVTSIEPVVNTFGQSEGYRMNVALAFESDYDKLIAKDPTPPAGIGGGND